MRFRIAILATLLLAACGQDVKTLRLDEVDLSDMTIVQGLGQQLDPADRSAFATFAAIHGRAEAGNCGVTLGGPDGKVPETIGEAIEAMEYRLTQLQPNPNGESQREPTARGPGTGSDVYRGASLAEVNERLDVIGR